METFGWIVFGIFVFGTAISLLAFLLPRRGESWPSVEATVLDIRVVPEEIKQGVAAYRGEALLGYDVNGRHYTVWVSAHVVDRDPDWVRQNIKRSGWSVRYNPLNPEQAEVNR
jgi:hypothetical protein